MNILHLLSQNHLTGAEVYAVQLAEIQLKDGHHVHQISNGFYFETRAVKQTLEVETKSKWIFFKNIFRLRKYIQLHQVQVVHSHSRAAAKLAFYATLFSRTAQVSSIHGQQHSSFSKKLFNQYGEFIIAVCENVKRHLLRDFNYNENRMRLIANPINEVNFSFKLRTLDFKKNIRVAIVGRTTGPKSQRTEQVLKCLFSEKFKAYPLQISLVGGEKKNLKLPDSLLKQVDELHLKELSSEYYAKYDLVIGAGRVCMESLISGIHSVAFGEAEYVGLIDSENFDKAVQSNFGDISPDSNRPILNEPLFEEELARLFNSGLSDNKNLQNLSFLASRTFSNRHVSKKVMRLYESAYFLKNFKKWIPVLMYHKVPSQEISSQHKIFVTAENFEKHLKFYKNRGFTALTFSELALFRKGQLSFKNFPKKPLILTFDDGYRDNLENASPLLKKYSFKAQIFLLADKNIDSNNWDHSSEEPAHAIISGVERQKWSQSAFEVGSHGFSHRKLTEFNESDALKELSESKIVLEKEFNREINVFAFTYGIKTDKASELAEQAGYDYAVNTDTGGLLLEENPYSIFRVNMFPDENLFSLYKKTSSWYRRYYFKKRKK